MDRERISAKLDRLVSYRLSTTGMASEHWAEILGEMDRTATMRAVASAVKIVLPDWEAEQNGDSRPRKALEAAEAWLAAPTEASVEVAKTAAKACTGARNDTFGRGHHVPEAARSLARAAGAIEGPHLYDALAAVEAELLARINLVGEYERGPEQRKTIVGLLRAELVPPLAPAAPAAAPVDTTPVPYAASGHFVVGQRLEHKKFGLVTVVAADATWIEVELADGSKKRLAHKPG